LTCDKIGCIGRLADGAIVAFARSIEALEEDCRRAALLVSPRTAPPDCAATVIDRGVLRRYGAMALRRVGGGFELMASRPDGYDRPWARAAPRPATRSEDISRAPSAVQPVPRDATPRPEDLEPGD
jgi:competence protein ComEC